MNNKNVTQDHARRAFARAVTARKASSFQPRQRVYFVSLLFLAIAATVCGPAYYSRRAKAQDARARFQQDLGQVFASHEDVTLDPQSLAARVRETGRLSLKTPSHDFELQLRPNDLRAPNYRAEEVGRDGLVHPVVMDGISTYKGS